MSVNGHLALRVPNGEKTISRQSAAYYVTFGYNNGQTNLEIFFFNIYDKSGTRARETRVYFSWRPLLWKHHQYPYALVSNLGYMSGKVTE